MEMVDKILTIIKNKEVLPKAKQFMNTVNGYNIRAPYFYPLKHEDVVIENSNVIFNFDEDLSFLVTVEQLFSRFNAAEHHLN